MLSSAKGTVIVTGANGGLGSAIVKQLASDPNLSSYYNIYTVRDATKVSESTSDSTHEFVSLDLIDLENVREVAKVINVGNTFVQLWIQHDCYLFTSSLCTMRT